MDAWTHNPPIALPRRVQAGPSGPCPPVLTGVRRLSFRLVRGRAGSTSAVAGCRPARRLVPGEPSCTVILRAEKRKVGGSTSPLYTNYVERSQVLLDHSRPPQGIWQVSNPVGDSPSAPGGSAASPDLPSQFPSHSPAFTGVRDGPSGLPFPGCVPSRAWPDGEQQTWKACWCAGLPRSGFIPDRTLIRSWE